jgi:hypothetical protein
VDDVDHQLQREVFDELRLLSEQLVNLAKRKKTKFFTRPNLVQTFRQIGPQWPFSAKKWMHGYNSAIKIKNLYVVLSKRKETKFTNIAILIWTMYLETC